MFRRIIPSLGIIFNLLNVPTEDGIIRRNIYASSSALVYFSNTLPSKSSIVYLSFAFDLDAHML